MARLSPFYSTPEPNAPIPLYEGLIQLGDSEAARPCMGNIGFVWRPKPMVRFDVPNAEGYVKSGGTSITVSGATLPAHARVSKVQTGMSTQRGTSLSGSLVSSLDLGSPTDIFSLTFHVPNFTHYFTGRKRVPPEQLEDDWVGDRMVMEAEGWKITLEAVEEADRLIESVESIGGHIITHIGKLERSDRSTFSVGEATELLRILRYFLSFVRGFWVDTLFPVGLDANDEKCWERWVPWRFDSWRYRPSWCDESYGDSLALAFPGFVSRWRNPLWHEPIRLGVHWYIEGNRGGGDSEPSIILTQAALELLAEMVLVEELQRVTEKDLDKKYHAHQKLRETILWAGIPTQIPASLTHLQKVGAAESWTDGPHAFTSTRNWIGHPTRKNREKFRTLTSSAINEAWNLGISYLELILLRLLDFQGPYSNRLMKKWSGEVEPVPWAKR